MFVHLLNGTNKVGLSHTHALSPQHLLLPGKSHRMQ